jgi:hypothetical protein
MLFALLRKYHYNTSKGLVLKTYLRELDFVFILTKASSVQRSQAVAKQTKVIYLVHLS